MASLPEVWRQWIPIDVDDFLGSHDLHSMTSDEFKGYTLLIFQQWKSNDGYLPLDELVLRKKAWLTQVQWDGAKEGILAKFDKTESGYANPRCRAELEKVQVKHQSKLANATRTNQIREEKRLANAERTQGHAPYSYSPSPSYSPSLSPSEEEVLTLDKEEIESLDGAMNGKKSTPGCAIFTSPVHLPEADPKGVRNLAGNTPVLDAEDSAPPVIALVGTQDESQGATPRAQHQQTPVDAAPSGKPNSNEPSAVSLPISDSDVESIRLTYPLKVGLEQACKAIKAQHALLTKGGRLKADGSKLPKMTSGEATAYLLERTRLYADSPKGSSKQFIPHPGTWFNDGRYTEDEATWNGDTNDNGNGSNGRDNTGTGDYAGVEGAIRRANEARGAGGGAVRVIPILGPEELKRKQKAARESSYGYGRGLAYSGPR